MANVERWHINKHGVPAPCHAKKGNCPLGGDGSHFDSEKSAQQYADKKWEEKYGLLSISKDIEKLKTNLKDVSSRVNKVEKVILPSLEDLDEPQVKVDSIDMPIILDKNLQRKVFNSILDDVYGDSVKLSYVDEAFLNEAKDYSNEEMLKHLDSQLKKSGNIGFMNREAFKEMFLSAQITGNVKAYNRFFKEHGEEGQLDYKWKREPTPSEQRTVKIMENKCIALGRDEFKELKESYDSLIKQGGLVSRLRANLLHGELSKYQDLINAENELYEFKKESTTMRFPEYFKNRVIKEYNDGDLESIRKMLNKRSIYKAVEALS